MEDGDSLDRVPRDGLPGSDLRSGLKEARQCEQWGFLGRGSSQCKGPETAAGAEWKGEQELEDLLASSAASSFL